MNISTSLEWKNAADFVKATVEDFWEVYHRENGKRIKIMDIILSPSGQFSEVLSKHTS